MIYIGWDSREEIAYDVCEFSIKKHSNIEIKPLKLKELKKKKIYFQEDLFSSTEFTYSRFFVPYLNNYKGWAIFCDCDYIWNIDPNKLLELADHKYAVQVVKHDYIPKNILKMDGQIQHIYPRKNWSSLILWNCSHPKNEELNLSLLNTIDAAYLHQFQWLDDHDIGELDISWNYLVDEYPEIYPVPNVLHYTLGGPYFKDYQNCGYNQIWKNYFREYKGYDFTEKDVLNK